MAGRVIKRLLDFSYPTRRQFFESMLKSWLVAGVVLVASFVASGQQPSTQQATTSPPSQTPQPSPPPQPTPLPQGTPFSTPTRSGPPAVPAGTPSAAPSTGAALGAPATQPRALSLDEALRLASALASNFQQAGLNEQIASEDVRQAQAAFLPRVTAPLSYLYTSPALGVPPGTPRAPSFIANNAISEYQAYMNIAGELDIAGRLRATLAKNRALLEAAHAGTEVARRALAQAVIDAYYGLALATAQHSAAEQNLLAAEEFERITSLLFSGGEVASVDLTRAQLQTIGRRDELERAKANEEVAAGSLRVLVGYEFDRPISTTDLAMMAAVDADASQFKVTNISRRPEFAQFDAQLRAVGANLRHIHRLTNHRQRMELARHFGAQVVADFPDALRQLVEKQRHFAVAQFLVNPSLATREITFIRAGNGRGTRRRANGRLPTGGERSFRLWTRDCGLWTLRSTQLAFNRARLEFPRIH